MIVLEGRLSVSTDGGTVTAGPGEIVYMPISPIVPGCLGDQSS
ncbi:UNVERIFIED_ORG: ethanolamine utilization protein EutQ (cupin superfamily) [Rhizobium sophorae]|jgi:ethanolamine utilization protein EutQ (cupin superfamily)|nr:ethanolamine utilization protein EutQ (cupin superfamily) [Rhizobium leguminosarum]MBB4523064.1 ethanolamine utilization protein EutQ (cupin superfamily) [Rhizobium leguminosarum]MDH6275291.1 ethanolamine utilization protein EutQ (cupin superfamily) [Rhizobium leguminosarum]MDH6659101.1 ethanolamine utilization protein EutQ (cupin superfamily) [Rhizobium sophorae]